MKTLRLILGILVLTLLVIQFFPTMENIQNEVPSTDLIQHRTAPSQVATLVHNACYDCHSNNTQYPWYDKIQPFAWILESHIIDAKRKLNFNEFETYDRDKQKKKFLSMRNLIQENKMPLSSYKMMHSESRLSSEEKKMVIDWIEEELKNY